MHTYTVAVGRAGAAATGAAGRGGAASVAPARASSRVRVDRNCFTAASKHGAGRLYNFTVLCWA